MFKIGDRVQRIGDAERGGIIDGGIYTVRDIRGINVWLDVSTTNDSFVVKRFRLVKRPRCGFAKFVTEKGL